MRVVAQLSEQRPEHDAGADLVLFDDFEEIVNVANDEIPLVEEAHQLELAEVAFHAVLSFRCFEDLAILSC